MIKGVLKIEEAEGVDLFADVFIEGSRDDRLVLACTDAALAGLGMKQVQPALTSQKGAVS